MNVPLPGQDHPLSFLIILGGALTVVGALLVFFWRRDWL